jgi:isoleucyl-tRNA synthetase
MADADNKSKSALVQIEEEILATWEKEKTFEKSMARRKDGPIFSFYDGPPFANGLPHYGHILTNSIKDATLRYKTMRGYNVPRRNGWDCHGLPVEIAVEKQLGVSGKKQILELGIEQFNDACRDSIFAYKAEWERLLKRLGRWSEYDSYYATVDTNYTESVWWALGQVHRKGLLYKGYRSTPYCPRCETPLSNFEVNDGYKDDISDPSLFVKFELIGENAHLLGWTTTPWSLPGNAAVAVNPKEQYVYAELADESGKTEVLILAKKRLEAVFKNEQTYKVLKELTGQELVGKQYKPLFELDSIDSEPNKTNLYKVWPADFVSIDDGTGVLHVAPAFGEDDLSLGQDRKIPILTTIDAGGKVKGGIGFDESEGMFFKKADRYIIEHLTHNGAVFAAETIKHTYPFCWRCETPLLYYAIDSWFIKVSQLRSQLVKTAEDINWVPGHIKTGRFGKWLEGARDWSISRNRYWGAPLPVWVNTDDSKDYIVVDSIAKLKELAGADTKLEDLHRPNIDSVTFTKDGKTYKRVEEVLDCWFESGCMSIAQQHYPFENEKTFKQTFPADFIIEGLDQTHLWFYVQHVVATILFDSPAYKNVIVNGMIMAADGQKLSKRLKNYPPVEDVFENEGADTLRLFLLSSTQATQVADYMRFNRDSMKDLNRNVLGTLQNSYKFFKMYADIDDWKPQNPLVEPSSDNVLDKWMLARLNQTITEVTTQADHYKLAHAINPIFELIDDMSNWFIRRSRRRFWKSEDDNDKLQAYATLHYTLVRVCQLLAPWAPFISDKIYRELMAGESAHLTDWPTAGKADATILKDMKFGREAITAGLKKRADAGIKVRQPLASAVVWSTLSSKTPHEFNQDLLQIIAEELNVKQIRFDANGSRDAAPEDPQGARAAIELDTTLTDELKAEGLTRDLIRLVQNARKQAELNVDDRIELSITSDDKLIEQAVKTHADTIKHETLALKLASTSDTKLAYHEEAKLAGKLVAISLQKI